MTVTIIPIEDHESYDVNGHIVYKDSSERWGCRTPIGIIEEKAFREYEKVVIDNPAFKKHPKSTYKPH